MYLFLSYANALMTTLDKSETLDSVTTKSSEPVKKSVTEFRAINTVAEVKNLNSKALIDPYAANADNRILVYSFITGNGTTHENYHDDYEHGAGRRPLQHERENHIPNSVLVITRWIGEGHIGP